MIGLAVQHPLVSSSVAAASGFGIAAWILRWEFRAWQRARRHGGYLVGGDK